MQIKTERPIKPAIAAARLMAIAVVACVLVLAYLSTRADTPDKKTDASSSGVDQDISKIRLDAHLTPENSVLFTFANGGPTMRLPKVLFPPSSIPSDPNQPIVAGSIDPIFWYPDMTPSGWTSVLSKLLENSKHTYVPEPDRSRVKILWMYYFAPEWDDLSPASNEWLHHLAYDPLPKRIVMNNVCAYTDDIHCMEAKTIHVRSAIRGLDVLANKKWAEEHPKEIQDISTTIDSGEYVSRNDSTYDLLMRCNNIECKAYGYSKTYHIGWRLLFPFEAIKHTDELMKSIDQMLARWSEK